MLPPAFFRVKACYACPCESLFRSTDMPINSHGNAGDLSVIRCRIFTFLWWFSIHVICIWRTCLWLGQKGLLSNMVRMPFLSSGRNADRTLTSKMWWIPGPSVTTMLYLTQKVGLRAHLHDTNVVHDRSFWCIRFSHKNLQDQLQHSRMYSKQELYFYDVIA